METGKSEVKMYRIEAENSLKVASTARSPLGRNAFLLLFATKTNMPGGVCG
jgi:hypothetical protein